MKRILAAHSVAALLLFARASSADLPFPTTVQAAGIQLGGLLSGATDPRATAKIRILDNTNQPLVGSVVELLFGNCGGWDLHVATAQSFPGMTWNCTSKVAAAVTDANGYASFRLAGSGSAGPGNPAGFVGGCVTVRADGVVLAVDVRLATYDLDGKNGVNAADQSIFMATLFAGPGGYRTRADYNGDGLCTIADLSKFLGVLLAGGSASSATPNCF